MHDLDNPLHAVKESFHWVNPKQGNDVNLKVFIRNKLIIVAEILNLSVGSRLSVKKKDCIIRNLSKYKCKKLLIYTVWIKIV